jgi:hypothetical protein
MEFGWWNGDDIKHFISHVKYGDEGLEGSPDMESDLRSLEGK